MDRRAALQLRGGDPLDLHGVVGNEPVAALDQKQIDFSISEYVMRLYQNGSASGTGTQKAKWSVYTSDLKSKYAESTTGTASNAKVTLLLEWQ